jgi:hypothetical protein
MTVESMSAAEARKRSSTKTSPFPRFSRSNSPAGAAPPSSGLRPPARNGDFVRELGADDVDTQRGGFR